MFVTPEEILRQCRVGEDSRAEFKKVRFGKRRVISPKADDLAGELVALRERQRRRNLPRCGRLVDGARDPGGSYWHHGTLAGQCGDHQL